MWTCTAPVACQKQREMRWQTAMGAGSGFTSTARAYLVKCSLVQMMSHGYAVNAVLNEDISVAAPLGSG